MNGAGDSVRPASRILVIKLRAIGDVLLSTVVLPHLRAAYPAAKIDFLCEAAAADVVRGNGLVDSVVVFDPARDGSFGLISRVRTERYDLVIDLFGNPRSAILALFSGARRRVGYRFSWRRFCYTDVVEPRGGSVHNTQFNLDALRRIGIPAAESGAVPTFPLTDEAEEHARNFFAGAGIDGRPCFAFNPGGGWYTKRWESRNFGEIAARLGKEFDARCIVVWGPGEMSRAEEIRTASGDVAVPIPPSTLKQLGAILRRCAAVITNDSGPMHIAAALGVPVVAIFGPTNPLLQGPVGSPSLILRKESLDCLGCNFTECPIGNPCMLTLEAAGVYDRILSFFRQHHIPGTAHGT